MYHYIKINGTEYDARIASYTCENPFTLVGTESVMSNFSSDRYMHDAYYKPKVTWKFGAMEIEDYREFVQNINSVSFECVYYDYELGQNVTREMKTDSREVARLQVLMNDVKKVMGITVTFSCVNGYLSYDDLRANKPAYVY